ncbi:MAG TPA: HEAT repeat domain-containing protein [Actinomycetota bacterium]|nr:HEAT repeat domain-containing protein [Actinomycetota bacterium]
MTPDSGFAASGSVRDRVHYLLVPTDDARWAGAVRALDPGEALEALAEVLADPGADVRARRQAALMVGVIGDDRGVPLLVQAATDPDEVLRARAVEAFANLDRAHPEVARGVVAATRDDGSFVRETAARALARLALPESRALLAELARDPAPEVRRAAEEAARALEGEA